MKTGGSLDQVPTQILRCHGEIYSKEVQPSFFLHFFWGVYLMNFHMRCEMLGKKLFTKNKVHPDSGNQKSQNQGA